MNDIITLEDSAGSGLVLEPDSSGEFLDYKRISIIPEKLKYHGIPSAELDPPTIKIKEVILTLGKFGYGYYKVELHANPLVGTGIIYNSHLDVSTTTPIVDKKNKAQDIYDNVAKVLKQGTFRLHVFCNETLGLEEITGQTK